MDKLIFGTLIAILSFSVSSYAEKMPHPISSIKTADAPKAEGPYSQAITVDLSKGKLIFVAGQVARDPKTNQMRESNIQEATQQTLRNIQAILKAGGSDMQYVIRTDVFLKNMKDWDGMNSEYIKHFSAQHFPARQTIQAGIDDRIEISCIAYIPNKN